ncbi:MAG: DUF819 family protein [Lewinellaceae bacterium]|nr:DUF819 family protein [Lewinellaceae bacterium]
MFTSNSLYVLAMLCGLVAGSEWLVRNTFARHFGTALLVIVLTAVLANIGFMPTGSTPENPTPVYDGIFAYVAPLSIFWLLLGVKLRDILQAGFPLLFLFTIGAIGTTLGVLSGMWVINGPTGIGPLYAAVGGMFTGTYIGGSVNFNAVALHYDVVREGALYGGTVAVDNILTTLWMIATLSLPRLLLPLWPKSQRRKAEKIEITPVAELDTDVESVDPLSFSMVLGLGFGSLFLSNALADWLNQIGWSVPAILIITTIALVIAQFPIAKRLKGGQLLGLFSVYLFLAVIGAFCDLEALKTLENLGLILLVMALVTVSIHGVFVFGAARLLRYDLDAAAVASQANVGGAGSALALARSLGRQDLVLPAVLLGALGTAIGTFIAFWVSDIGLPWLLG